LPLNNLPAKILADRRPTRSQALDPPWLAIKPRQLATLVAVGRERSFRRAAERLGCAPSAVSQLVAKLERGLGVLLVERARGRPHELVLTDAGRALVRHAGGILAELEAASGDLGRARAATPEELRIGATQSAGSPFVGTALARLLGEFREHRLVVNTWEPPEAQLALVEDGELAAAITDLPPPTRALTATELWREPWAFVVPAGSRWKASLPPSAADIAASPLLVAGSDQHTRLLEASLLGRGLALRLAWTSGSARAVREVVASGNGLAIVPALAIAADDSAVIAFELTEELLPARRVALVHRRSSSPSPALRRLVTCLRNEAAARLAGPDGPEPLPVAG
jgi:DNA-binding transcriptional LysR family regulator